VRQVAYFILLIVQCVRYFEMCCADRQSVEGKKEAKTVKKGK